MTSRPLFAAVLLLGFAILAQGGDDPPPAAGELRAAIARHLNEERPSAARAILELGARLEADGELEGAREQYRLLGELFPERRGDGTEAERRLRALRERGGQFFDQLLERAAKSRGAERLKRLESVLIKGSLKLGGASHDFVRRMSVHPIRVREDAPKLGLSKCWNGAEGWLRKGREVERLSGPKLDRAVAWAQEELDRVIGRRRSKNLAFGGLTQVEGRPAYRIEVRQGGELWTEDLDRETLLPARAEGRHIDELGRPGPMTLYYRDWKDLGGARFPGRIEFYRGDDLAFEFRYDSYELDPALADSVFNEGD